MDENTNRGPAAPGLHRRVTAGAGGSGCGPANPCATGEKPAGSKTEGPPPTYFGGGNGAPSAFKVVTFHDGEDRRRWIDAEFYFGPKDFPVDKLDPENRPTAVFSDPEDARLFLRVKDATPNAKRYLEFLDALAAMKSAPNGAMFHEAVALLKDVFGD